MGRVPGMVLSPFLQAASGGGMRAGIHFTARP